MLMLLQSSSRARPSISAAWRHGSPGAKELRRRRRSVCGCAKTRTDVVGRKNVADLVVALRDGGDRSDSGVLPWSRRGHIAINLNEAVAEKQRQPMPMIECIVDGLDGENSWPNIAVSLVLSASSAVQSWCGGR